MSASRELDKQHRALGQRLSLTELNRRRRELVKDVTLEQRRAFVQALHDKKDFMTAAREANLTFDQAIEIQRLNTRKIVRMKLVDPEDVK